MSKLRQFAMTVTILAAVGLAFVGFRLWHYQRREPLRQGVTAWKSGDYDLARVRLQPFADQGDVLAQRIIGEMYAQGIGVPADDRQATMWFRRAECRCLVAGQAEYDVALNLSDAGLGIPDYEAAARWLQRAAEAGHPDAQRLLADPSALNARGLRVNSSVSDYWRRRLTQ